MRNDKMQLLKKTGHCGKANRNYWDWMQVPDEPNLSIATGRMQPEHLWRFHKISERGDQISYANLPA